MFKFFQNIIGTSEPERIEPFQEDEVKFSADAHLKDKQYMTQAKTSVLATHMTDIKDCLVFSTGIDNQIPVMLAAFLLSSCQPDKFILSLLSNITWCDADSDVVKAWIAANENTWQCFSQIAPYLPRQIELLPEGAGREEWDRAYAYDSQELSWSTNDDFIQNIFAERVSSTSAGYMSREAYRRLQPEHEIEFMAVSEAHNLYYQHPLIAGPRKELREAYMFTMQCVEAWFKRRGFNVDETNHLLTMPGYQPFYFVSSADY